VGGRWVTLDNGEWLRKHIPADLIVFGEAESRIAKLVDAGAWAGIPGTDRTGAAPPRGVSADYPILDYRIAEGYRDLTPSVEVSRGCGRKCAFCLEADAPLWALRSPASLAAQIRKVQEAYDAEWPLKMYFECSSFTPSSRWAAAVSAENLGVLWRTEARVDAIAPELMPALASMGLRVLDLGLESADPVTLRRMNKTKDPERYLSAADALLRACHANGVWAKVNIVLYAGESLGSVARTTDWLSERANMIKGVSAGPLIVYRGMRNSHVDFLAEVAELGARPVRSSSLEDDGFAELHLSDEIDNEAAEECARRMSRIFMTHRNYFELKSFGYFPRSLTFDAFEAHLAVRPESEWPFRRA
jgi:hypothetical protein